jgi:hypothetical protein
VSFTTVADSVASLPCVEAGGDDLADVVHACPDPGPEVRCAEVERAGEEGEGDDGEGSAQDECGLGLLFPGRFPRDTGRLTLIECPGDARTRCGR